MRQYEIFSVPDFDDLIDKEHRPDLIFRRLEDKLSNSNLESFFKILIQLKKTDLQSVERCYVENSWRKLVEDTKKERKKDAVSFSPLSYTNIPQRNISDIVIPIEIYKVETCNISGENLISTDISYTNFHKVFVNNNNNRVLIQGDSGMGKSIQKQYLVHQWMNDRLNGFENRLIVTVNLKDVKSNHDIYDAILDQNFRNITYMSKELLIELFNYRNPELLLFIDEANEYSKLHSSIKDIIECSECPVQTAVWLRKWKAVEIRHKNIFNEVFELAGIDDEQLRKLIGKYFRIPVCTPSFIKQLSEQKRKIRNLCKVPLLAILMFHIWEKNGKSFEKNSFFIYNNLITNVYKYNNSRDEDVDSALSLLYERCFECLDKEIVTFNTFINDNADFLKEVLEMIPSQSNGTYIIRFHHPSFQTFFAAKHAIRHIRNCRNSRNQKAFAEKFLRDFTSSKIKYYILELIKDYDRHMYTDIFKVPSKFQCIFEFNERIHEIMSETKELSFPIAQNPKGFGNDHDMFSSILLENIGDTITKVNFLNTDMTLLHKLKENCPTLENINYTVQCPLQCVYDGDSFLSTIFSLKSSTNLKTIKWSDRLFKIDFNSRHSVQKRWKCIEEVHVYQEENPRIICIKLTDGSSYIKSVRDRCRSFFKFDSFFKFIEKYKSIEYLVLENKLFGREQEIAFFHFIKSGQFNLQVCCIRNSLIEELNEDFIKNVCSFVSPHLPQNELENESTSYNSIDLFIDQCNHQLFLLNAIDDDISIMDYFPLSWQTITSQESRILSLLIHAVEDKKLRFKNFHLSNIVSILHLQKQIEPDMNSGIECLNLSEKSYSEISELFPKLVQCSYRSLKHLDISNCRIFQEFSELISWPLKICTYLESLNISKNPKIVDKALENLNPDSIKHLNLSHCEIEPCVIASLSKFKNLENINLSYNCLFGSYIRFSSALKPSARNLRHLNLSHCNLTNVHNGEISKLLSDCRNLESLNLSFNMLGNKSKDIMQQLLYLNNTVRYSSCSQDWSKHIKHLDFSHFNLSEEEARVLGKSLRKFPLIEVLNIGHNGDLGEGLFDIFTGLENSSGTLKEIGLSNCCLTAEHIYHLEDLLDKCAFMRKLDLSHNVRISSKFKGIFLKLRNSSDFLSHLYLSFCAMNEKDGEFLVELLRECSNIESLRLDGNTNPKFENIMVALKFSKEKLKFLDFSRCKLSINQQLELASLLEECQNLKSIHLGWNNFTQKGFRFIVEALIKLQYRLRHVHFPYCNLRESGEQFEKWLQKCYQIESLDLSDNKLMFSEQNPMLHSLLNLSHSLRILNLCDSSLSESQTELLSMALANCSRLEVINLKKNKNMGQAFEKLTTSLAKLKSTLKDVNFSSCCLSKNQACFLSTCFKDCKFLERVDLSYNRNMNSEVDQIILSLGNSSQSLKYLNFALCNFTPTSSSALGQLLQKTVFLETLILRGNKFCSDVFGAIDKTREKSSGSIRSIDLSYCDLGVNEAIHIAEYLNHALKLDSIDLSGNKYIDRGFALFFLAITKTDNILRSLNFSSCSLTEEKMEKLNSSTKLIDINLKDNPHMGNNIATLMKSLILVNSQLNIKRINLSYCNLTRANLKDIGVHLEKFTLEAFSLEGNKIWNNPLNLGLKNSSSKLKFLNISFCNLTIEQAQELSGELKEFLCLESVNFSGNSKMGVGLNEIIKSFEKSCNTLKDINFSSCNLREDQAECLANCIKKCSNLNSLNLSLNTKMKQGFKSIALAMRNSGKSVEHLNFSSCNLSRDQAASLKEFLDICTNLKTINLTENPNMQDSLEELLLILSKTLVYLNLSFCKLSLNQIKSLESYLSQSPTIEVLLLRGSLNSLNINYLIRGLDYIVRTLKIIDISLNSIKSQQQQPLETVLGKCSNLTTIDFSCCVYTTKEILNWQEMIELSSNSLQNLALSNCFLSKSSAESLAKGLKRCCNLRSVKLNYNTDMLDGLNDIFNALKESSSTLQNLNVSNCSLSEGQIATLVVLLNTCQNLESLDVSGNPSMKDTVRLILQSIKSFNKTLKNLNLSYCRIQKIEEIHLQLSLTNCNTLESLKLKGNELESPIDLLKESNKTLQYLEIENSMQNVSKKKFVNLREIIFIRNKDTSTVSYENLHTHISFQLVINIDLSSCDLRMTQAIQLADCVKQCVNLEVLDLSNNKNMSSGFKKILLGLNHNLKKLSLSFCDLSTGKLNALCERFSTISNLESLNLEGNNNLSRIMKVFAKSLKESGIALREIDLSDCNLDDDNVDSLKILFKSSFDIEKLSLREGSFSTKRFRSICKSLENLYAHLKYLDFRSPDFNKKKEDILRSFVEKCSQLKSQHKQELIFRGCVELLCPYLEHFQIYEDSCSRKTRENRKLNLTEHDKLQNTFAK
ncbi:unnamed protein product [Dimorphilus gyrociliatus]|uniref:Uncharacterized protein n=1 Tax=Dimorphilus gyrociliatus TaxID=2664684 RepID=A0A7I8VK94_9ANNE|nr:unnamed protein product [Dimorphilus gyrociliatus]